jgi:hypothetical protein
MNTGSSSNSINNWRNETETLLDSPSPAALWTAGAMREENDYEASCDDFDFLDDLGFASGDGYTMGGGDSHHHHHQSNLPTFFYSTSGGTSNQLPLMLPEEQPAGSSAVEVAAAVAAATRSSPTTSQVNVGKRTRTRPNGNRDMFDSAIGGVFSAEATQKILDDLHEDTSQSDSASQHQRPQQRRRVSKTASPRSPRKTKAQSQISGSSVFVPNLNADGATGTRGSTSKGNAASGGAKSNKGGSSSSSNGGKSNGTGSQRTSNRSLPSHVVDYLKAWLHDPQHINHPFPTDPEKQQMLIDTGLDLKRLNNWFVNYRYRHWKPQMEADGKLIVNKHGGGNSACSGVSNNSQGRNTNKTSTETQSTDPRALTVKVTPQLSVAPNLVNLPPVAPSPRAPPQQKQTGARLASTLSGASGVAVDVSATVRNSPTGKVSSSTVTTKDSGVAISLPTISSKTTSFGVPNPILASDSPTNLTDAENVKQQ